MIDCLECSWYIIYNNWGRHAALISMSCTQLYTQATLSFTFLFFFTLFSENTSKNSPSSSLSFFSLFSPPFLFLLPISNSNRGCVSGIVTHKLSTLSTVWPYPMASSRRFQQTCLKQVKLQLSRSWSRHPPTHWTSTA